jgi:hypothetical protein
MKGRKSITVALAVLLSLSIPSVFSSNDTITVEYSFDSLVITECGQWIEGTFLQEIPGEPLIPYYPARILLPQDATLKDVKVKPGAPVIQKGIDIPWGQPPCTFSDEPVSVEKNDEIYNSDNDYPNTLFTIVSTGSFRGFNILNLHLYPVQYKPKSGTVKFYETMTVEVKFGKGLKNKLYRGLYGDKQDVSSIVDNPDMVGTYGDGGITLPTEEYIIITNDTMKSAFQKLADWKANYVDGYGVYTVSWITANYSGVDNAEKVRNFIIDWYTNHGTQYVLMGGDIAAVPYRGFYVYTGGYTDYDMLADMYFRCLDGTFNDDGDSYWAEPNDGVDWYAEVAVGRAPCETVTEAEDFVDKVITYEKASKPYRALLHQARVRPGNSPDSRCLAWNCDDYLPYYYYKDYLFEEDGNVSKTDWRNAWAANPVAVAHIGHGSSTSYQINYEIGGTVTWYCSDVSTMTNTFWPWTTSVACHSGNIETNDCLAECYVKDANNGAIAAIYNDNYGWFNLSNACMYSGEFCEMEFKACWEDGEQKLGDMLNQALSYMISSAQSNSYYRWCFYERNLVGDPESPCLTARTDVCGSQVGNGWNFTDYLVGSWTGDGTDDLIVRNSSGTMWLYPFRNNTFYGHSVTIVGQNFNYTHYLVGSWTGNGTDDLIVRDSSGTMWLYEFNGTTFLTPVQVGQNWNYTHYLPGYWAGNGTDDLVCRDSNGYMWLLEFNGSTFLTPVRVGHGWNFTDYFAGHWTGDGTADLIVRKSNGEMWLYPFRNKTFYGHHVTRVGLNFNYTHYFPGYWTGNGTDDLICRDSGGEMWLREFNGTTFLSAVQVAQNWNYTHYFPGYWTGDGTDDMIVRDSGAYLYLYPFRSKTFCPWVE